MLAHKVLVDDGDSSRVEDGGVLVDVGVLLLGDLRNENPSAEVDERRRMN